MNFCTEHAEWIAAHPDRPFSIATLATTYALDILDLAKDGVTAVAVVEKVVFGVVAYHAKCLACGWRCHMEAHDKQATALEHAKAHVCEVKP